MSEVKNWLDFGAMDIVVARCSKRRLEWMKIELHSLA